MPRVDVQETHIELLTYGWGPAYDEPPLIREFCPRGQPIYPYTSQEALSDDPPTRTRYRAVVLENECLRLTFLPELNGRLYSAFDKVNQAEALYANEALKPALFGLRGAWCAAGVEYNFPNSHSTTTLEPIDGFVREYPDGSASYVCGNVEWVSRMSWCMEVRLRPGSAAIEMTSRLYNGGDFPRRFYYWVNAAVPVYEQSQFIYPPSTRRLLTHPPMDSSRIAYVDYPTHDGQDVSHFGNIRQHFPIFAERMQEDFFGIYHHHLDRGLVHVADHALVPGRKVWTFGCARDGRIWVDLLTDSDVDYAELQSGPFPLQSDYRLFPPGAVHVQEETWLPVAGIGGFNAASQALAANVCLHDGSTTVRLCASRELPGVTLRVMDPEGRRSEDVVSLEPLVPQEVELPLGSDTATVACFDSDGQQLLKYVSAQTARAAGMPSRPKPEIPASSEGYHRGLYAEQQGSPRDARQHYERAAPDDLAARAALARMLAASGQMRAAIEEADAVLAVDREHPEALHVQALGLLRTERLDEAEQTLSVMTRVWPARATALLAELSVMRGDYGQALSRLSHWQSLYGDHPYARGLQALCLRKRGAHSEARACLGADQTAPLLEPLFRGEQLLLGVDGPVSVPTDQQAIEIACRYLALGAREDARQILTAQAERSGDAVAPLLLYYKSHAERRLRLASDASASPAPWHFPFRVESVAVLREALAYGPDDSTLRYQLGNLFASLERWDEAAEQWGRVAGPLRSRAQRNIGLYWWQIKGEISPAERAYAEAATNSECGAMTLWEYDHLLEEMGQSAKRLAMLKSHEAMVRADRRLLLRLASACAAHGELDEALEILASGQFPLCEGKMLPRLIYEDLCRARGEQYAEAGEWQQAVEWFSKPLDYPENLGTGKPAGNLEAEWCYRAAEALGGAGDEAEARSLLRQGAEPDRVLRIDFFPLKHLVWEHPGDTIDLYVWRNRIYRAKCCDALGQVGPRDAILAEVQSLVREKVDGGRGDESEVQMLRRMLADFRRP